MNKLIRNLNKISPSVCIEVLVTLDDLPWDGDGPSPARSGHKCYQSEVRVSVIVGGEIQSASDHLGGSWYRSPEQLIRQDISGYLPQMIDGAAGQLLKELPAGNPERLALDTLCGYLTREMKRRYDAHK